MDYWEDTFYKMRICCKRPCYANNITLPVTDCRSHTWNTETKLIYQSIPVLNTYCRKPPVTTISDFLMWGFTRALNSKKNASLLLVDSFWSSKNTNFSYVPPDISIKSARATSSIWINLEASSSLNPPSAWSWLFNLMPTMKVGSLTWWRIYNVISNRKLNVYRSLPHQKSQRQYELCFLNFHHTYQYEYWWEETRIEWANTHVHRGVVFHQRLQYAAP